MDDSKSYLKYPHHRKWFNKLWIATKLIYSKNLNYQWELDNEEVLEEWYRPGVDVTNFHATINLSKEMIQ